MTLAPGSLSNITRSLAALALAVAAGCSVSEGGKIKCVDDSSCPNDYPVCSAGFCIEGTPAGGGISAVVLGVAGKASTDPIRGTVTVQVVARATAGVKSVALAGSGQTFSPAADAKGPSYDIAVDTTKLPEGVVALTATVTSGDDKAGTSAPLNITVDNKAPSITGIIVSPIDATDGSLVKFDATADEKLSSLAGTVATGGVIIGTVSEIAASSASGTGELRHLGFAVTPDRLGGTYTVSFVATDVAGNQSAAAVKTFNLRKPFVSSLALTSAAIVGGVAAGRATSALVATFSLPLTADLGTAQPTFTLTDAATVKRTLAGTITVTQTDTLRSFRLDTTIAASDADGLAVISASVTDPSLNVSAATQNLRIDNLRPALSGLAVAAATVQNGDTVTLTAVANKPVSSATYTSTSGEAGSCTCNGGGCSASAAAGQLISCSYLATAASAGVATATIALGDAVGNTSDGAVANNFKAYTVVAAPAVTLFSVSPSSILASTPTTVTINSTLPAGVTGVVIMTGSTESTTFAVPAGVSSKTVIISETTTFSLTATNAAGHTVNGTPQTVTAGLTPAISAFTAQGGTTALALTSGGSVTLSASFSSASAISSSKVSNGIPAQDLTITNGGSVTFNTVTANTTYTLSVINPSGTSTKTVAVTVVPAAAITTFVVTGGSATANLTVGDSILLTPTFSNGTGRIKIGGTVVASNVTSGVPVSLTPASAAGATTTYTLEASNAATTVQTATSDVVITSVAAPTAALSVTVPSSSTLTTGVSTAVTLQYTVPAGTTVGGTANTASIGVNGIEVVANGSLTKNGGAQTVSPATTNQATTYTLTVTNRAGKTATATTTVLAVPKATISVFTVNGSAAPITATAAATIAVLATFADNVSGATISDGGAPVAITSGGAAVNFTAGAASTSKTYTLTLPNASGPATTAAIAVQNVAAATTPTLTFGSGLTATGAVTVTSGTFFLNPIFAAGLTARLKNNGTSAIVAADVTSGVAIQLPATLVGGAGTTVNFVLEVSNAATTPSTLSSTLVAVTSVAAPTGTLSISAPGSQTITSGVSQTVTLQYSIPAGTTANGVANSATITSTNGAGDTIANGSLTKDGSSPTINAPVSATQTTVYTLTVTNAAGTVFTAAAVTLTAVPKATISVFTLNGSAVPITATAAANVAVLATFANAVGGATISDGTTSPAITSGGAAVNFTAGLATTSKTYTLSVPNASGAATIASMVVPNVASAATPTLTFGSALTTSGSVTVTTGTFVLNPIFVAGLTGRIKNGAGTVVAANVTSGVAVQLPATVVGASGTTVNFVLEASNAATTPSVATSTPVVAVTSVDAPLATLVITTPATKKLTSGTSTAVALQYNIPAGNTGSIAANGVEVVANGALTKNGTNQSANPGSATQTTVYVLTVTNAAGSVITATDTITASPPAAITKMATPTLSVTEADPVSFTISITGGTPSGSATLSNGTGAQDKTITLDGSGSATNATPASHTAVLGTNTYTLTVPNPGGGNTTRQVIVTGFGAPAITSFTGPATVAFGSSGTLNFTFNCDGTGGAGSGTCGSATVDTASPTNVIGLTSTTTGTLTTSRAFSLAVTNLAGKLVTADLFVHVPSWTVGSDLTLVNAAASPATLTALYGTTATLLWNGKVLIAGGCNDSSGATCDAGSQANSSDKAKLYDPALNSFTDVTNVMSCNRYGHTATTLPDGNVMFAGGCMKGVEKVDIYNPTTNAFTAGPCTLSVTRYAPTATMLPNGKVLIAGGASVPGAGPTYSLSAELIDYSTGAATCGALLIVAPMGMARAFHTATLLASGKVLLAGGTNGTDTAANKNDLYDFTKTLADPAAIVATGDLAASALTRFFHTATRLPNGKVLLIGGAQSIASAPVATTEIFDPAAGGTFAAGPPLNTVRKLHSATMVSTGAVVNGVLVVGGSATAGTSVELYNPGTNLFTTTQPQLGINRKEHSATMLWDGRLVVFGGSLTNVGSTELYAP